jgi:DNA topoisomerase-1
MAKHTVVIVESPAKCKTVQKHMGAGHIVLASCGHVRDLIPKNGAVEIDNNFAMHYQTLEQSTKYLAAIAKALKSAKKLLLATDPDREGEAIAWHVYEWLKENDKLPQDIEVHRVVFNQITKHAIKEALAKPRQLSQSLIDAQQARRALDYLVGFNLSPLLWKKIRRGLSAGRVQSPALKMIVERELAIESFESKEYWSIQGLFESQKIEFKANLFTYREEKQSQFSIVKEQSAKEVKLDILENSKGKGVITDVKKSVRKRNPAPPFMTSTLQQEAARKLGFNTTKTMKCAQKLYEGIDIGDDSVGLITYMRTDSVNLATEAIEEIRSYISKYHELSYLPKTPNVYKSKAKNAQEAHEAIRPTDIWRTPESIKNSLDPDLFKLYKLIWQRTLASQMIFATFDVLTVLIDCKVAVFKSTGSVIKHPGFISVYQEDKDDEKDEEGSTKLPDLVVDEVVNLLEILTNQHFTEPPPRFTEASLVKALEEHGIGRPSTYASIIATLKAREYVLLDKKRFYPTDVGKVVSNFLKEYFTQYVSYDFTADLEDKLDNIANDNQDWVPVMDDFWHPFITAINKIDTSVSRSDVTQTMLDEKCPECDAQLSTRLGKRGSFIGCSAYPECKYTRNNSSNENTDAEPAIKIDYNCPKCDSELLTRNGRYGSFIGCSNYPKCKYIESKNAPKEIGFACFNCENGALVEKKTKKGKLFYACNQFPKCKTALWNKPIQKDCPLCKAKFLVIKTTKKDGTQLVCNEDSCSFTTDFTDD